jgi:Ca2+-binding EF-hand superfamily protein
MEDLIHAMRQIKTVEHDPQKVERIARVLRKLDDNQDGKIEVDDLVKVCTTSYSTTYMHIYIHS